MANNLPLEVLEGQDSTLQYRHHQVMEYPERYSRQQIQPPSMISSWRLFH